MKYISCKYLRHAIQFWKDEISICCQSGIRFPEYFTLRRNYNGEKINWKELFELREKSLEDLKNNNPNKYCNGCIYMKEDYWDEYKPFINSIIISHWTNCNCNCIYCKLDKKPKKKPYAFLPILKEMKKQNILVFNGHLLFGGGEPTCLKEFPKILEFFYKNNIEDVQINSSGIDFSRTIAKYISKENTMLTISVDSADKLTYQRIKRVNKFEQVWKNIKKYTKAQKDNIYGVRTKYILLYRLNDSKTEIYNWLLLSKNAGVNCVIMDMESVWFSRIKNNIPERIIDLFNYFEEKAEELNLKTEYYAVGEFIKPKMKKYQSI